MDIGTVTDEPTLTRRVAAVAGVAADPSADPLAAVIARLGAGRFLLVLDTCEHLLGPVAEVATRLLEACPGLGILATSRELLSVVGETTYPVPPLTEEAAAELFLDRARLAHPRVEIPADEEVNAICAKVDRIPLGIELAAAWMGTLSPRDISAGLDDALGMLAAAGRTTIDRHRTLRASLEWSHDLLAGEERVLFRRLGVFAGAFTSEAAAAIAGDSRATRSTLLILRRLVAASLVTAHPAPTGTRFRQLDTVRQFALDQLAAADEASPTRERHLAYHLWLAEEGERGLDIDQDRWREALTEHHDDIAAAIRWALAAPGADEDRVEKARRLVAAMARHWMLTGNTREGLELLDRATSIDPGPSLATAGSGVEAATSRALTRSRLWSGTAMLAMVSGHRQLVTEAAERGLAEAERIRDLAAQARCRMMLAYPLFFTDFARCQALAAQAGRDGGDPFVRDWCKVIEGYSYQTRGRHAEALAAAREAVDGALPRGDRFTAAFGLGVQLFVTLVSGRVDEAIALGRDSVDIAAALGDYFARGTITVNAAQALAVSGDLAGARDLMRPIITSLPSAPPADVVGLMVPFGYTELWAGDLDTALRWFTRGVQAGPGGVLDWTAGRCLPGLVKTLRLTGDPGALAQAERAVEVERDFDTPYELALALDELAYLTRTRDPARAYELHHDALAVRVRHGIRLGYPDSLDALAGLAADAGNPARAARLYAAATAARTAMHYPRPLVDRPAYAAAISQLRGRLADEFQAVWSQGRRWDIDDAVAAVTRGRGPRRRPDAGWDSLTPTERQIVDLVAAGLSNPQIADRLFVSRSTVKTHLTHVYHKLGVTNRTHLAAMANSRPEAPA